MNDRELLTSVVGSHAHPGWFAHGVAVAARMRERGLGDAEQQRLFVHNPARLYAFREVTR